MRFFNQIWIAPLLLFQAYLSAVAALFFFGPWDWALPNARSLAIFLLSANLAILVGYLLGWPIIATVKYIDPPDRRAAGITFLKWGLFISILMMVPTSLARTGLIFPNVLSGITCPGAAYFENVIRSSGANRYVIFEYVRFATYPFIASVFPMVIVLWKTIGIWLRTLGVISIAFYLGIFVANGQNKGLADLAVLLPFFLILSAPFHPKFGLKTVITWLFIILLGLLLTLAFFRITQAARATGVCTSSMTADVSVLPPVSINQGPPTQEVNPTQPHMSQFGLGDIVIHSRDHWFGERLPPVVNHAVEALAAYLGQGYYVVGRTLDMAHPSTLGLGNSMFFSRNADRVFHTEFFEAESIPSIYERLTGWSRDNQWHSIYPWLASDLGYWGSIVAIGFFGFFLSVSWGMSLKTSDGFWIVLLSLILTIFYYIPANNQIFQTGETAIAFCLVSAIIISRFVYGLWFRRYLSRLSE